MDTTPHAFDDARIARATALAREYDALMGLTYVAMGIGFLLAAVMPLQPAVWIALGSAFGAMSAGWYHKRYGFTRPLGSRTALAAVGAVVAILVVLTGFVLDRWLTPPISLSLLAVALVLGLGQWLLARRIGLTPIHWVVYALLVVAAFGPLVGLGRGGLFSPYVLAVTGVALIIVGLVDHLRLTRLLAPVRESGEPETDAPARVDVRDQH